MTTFADALDLAITEEMRRDERIFCMATGHFSQEFVAEFGPKRVRRTPIAEAAMTGIAIGAAGCGFRPIVFLQCVTFSFAAFDQVVNQAAKIRYMSGGQRAFPIVFRAAYLNGTRSAAQHSQTGYSMYAQSAGLKIIVPSRPSDARGLMRTAIRDENPVMIFEARRLEALSEDLSNNDAAIPFGQAAVRRAGSDITIVAVGYMVEVALAVAQEMESAMSVSVEVIDPRSLVPLDVATLRQSVQKTGRLIVIDESHPMCSIASEIVATVAEDGSCLRALRAPPLRVCAAPVPVPFSSPLEDFVLPGAERLRSAVEELLAIG